MAKLLYSLILCFTSFVIMMACGSLFFGIRFTSPVAFLLGGLLTCLACTGLMALVSGFLVKARKSEAIASIIIVVMSMMGGSFMPVQSMPQGLQNAARFTLNFWGIDLLQGAMQEGWRYTGLLTDTVVLAIIAALTMLGGAAAMHRRIVKGVVR